jgi:hypothetical protein
MRQTNFLSLILVGILGITTQAQTSTTQSLRQALINNKALFEMTAPKAISINGFQETYMYTLTLKDVFFGTGGNSKFSLVMASSAGLRADAINLTFVGLYSDLKPAIANTQHLVMMAGLCLSLPNTVMTTLNQNGELLNVLVRSLEERATTGLERTYGAVKYTLNNIGYGKDQAQNELVKYSISLQGSSQSALCQVRDE